MKLEYICEGCGQAIEDGEGGIAVSYSEIHQVEQEERAFDKKYAMVGPDGESRGVMISGSAWQELPGEAVWHTGHWRCMDVKMPYDIAVEDLRTHAQVLGSVAHLLGKDWVQCTDLQSWLYRLDGVD